MAEYKDGQYIGLDIKVYLFFFFNQKVLILFLFLHKNMLRYSLKVPRAMGYALEKWKRQMNKTIQLDNRRKVFTIVG